MFRKWLNLDRSKVSGSDTVNISVVINRTMQINPNGSRRFSYSFNIPELKVKTGIYIYDIENVHTLKKVMNDCMEVIRTIIPHPVNVNIIKLSVNETVENVENE